MNSNLDYNLNEKKENQITFKIIITIKTAPITFHHNAKWTHADMLSFVLDFSIKLVNYRFS